MYSFCNDNIRIVDCEKGNIGITVNGMGDKPLLEFDNKLLWLEELSPRGNDKSIVRLGAFSMNEEGDLYLIEEVLVDIVKCKYLRSLIGITKERPKRVKGEVYKYYDTDGKLCLLDFKTNLLRVGEDALKYLEVYDANLKYFRKNSFVYEETEWLCDYMYQAVESSKEGHSICLVSVRDKENKVSRIEQDIRNSLGNCGEIVTGFEIKPFECGNSVNPLMRELVISFSNFERLHFILKLDRDNPDSYRVYNMVYSCSFNHYHSIINQHRATNVFLNKKSFLLALSKLSLRSDGRKSTQIDNKKVQAKLEKTVKRLSRRRRKLLID